MRHEGVPVEDEDSNKEVEDEDKHINRFFEDAREEVEALQ